MSSIYVHVLVRGSRSVITINIKSLPHEGKLHSHHIVSERVSSVRKDGFKLEGGELFKRVFANFSKLE